MSTLAPGTGGRKPLCALTAPRTATSRAASVLFAQLAGGARPLASVDPHVLGDLLDEGRAWLVLDHTGKPVAARRWA